MVAARGAVNPFSHEQLDPGSSPRATNPVGVNMPKGYLFLVLHAPLPALRPAPGTTGFWKARLVLRRPITETYIPLIKFFDRLRDERAVQGDAIRVADPEKPEAYDGGLAATRSATRRHLDLSIGLAEHARVAAAFCDWKDVNSLSWMYKRTVRRRDGAFVESACGTRLVSAPSKNTLPTPATWDDYLRHARLSAPARTGHGASPGANGGAGASTHLWAKAGGHVGAGVPYFPGLDEYLAEAGIHLLRVDSHGIGTPGHYAALFGVNARLAVPPAWPRSSSSSRRGWSGAKAIDCPPTSIASTIADIGFDLDQDYLEPFQYA